MLTGDINKMVHKDVSLDVSEVSYFSCEVNEKIEVLEIWPMSESHMGLKLRTQLVSLKWIKTQGSCLTHKIKFLLPYESKTLLNR